MSGNVGDAQTAAFLIALRTKGETRSELAGLARTMRAHALPVNTGRADLVDTAGTGGGTPTFNVSTTAAFVACGAGCAIAKHGNRSNTSKSGSADLLEALGAKIELSARSRRRADRRNRLRFHVRAGLPRSHEVRGSGAQGARGAHGFNFLGPLTNPAGASHQLIGVSDPRVPGGRRGGARRARHRALDGRARNGPPRRAFRHARHARDRDPRLPRSTSHEVTPEDLGLETVEPGRFQRGTPEENAATTRAVLSGSDGPGPYAYDHQCCSGDLRRRQGQTHWPMACNRRQSRIDTGAAHDKLNQFVERSQLLAS